MVAEDGIVDITGEAATRYEVARRCLTTRVRDILKREGISAAPVQLTRALRGSGHKIHLSTSWGQVGGTGLLSRVPGGYLIQVDSNASPARQRFVVAHEFAHILLREESEAYLGCDSRSCPSFGLSSREKERLCNEVAAELLLPTELMLAEGCSDKPNLLELLRIARIFGVSHTLAARRLVETLWTAVAFMTREMGGRHHPVELRVKWVTCPQDSDVHVPVFQSIPSQSIVRQAHYCRTLSGVPSYRRFSTSDREEYQPAVFQSEQTVELGNLGRLGFLKVEAARLRSVTMALVQLS